MRGHGICVLECAAGLEVGGDARGPECMASDFRLKARVGRSPGSRFVVADYTGQRNNVYFEAGFALGLGLTVIQTCRADEAADLHFDIRHLNTLKWKSHAELAEGLNKRIRAVLVDRI